MRSTMLSSFISKFQKQRVAIQSIVATIPFVIYFSDEFYSITYVRGPDMEPTVQDGDFVLIRKRDAGKVLLNILNSISSFIASSSPSMSSDANCNRIKVDDAGNTETALTKQLYKLDDDRIQALRYQLENCNDSTCINTNKTYYWFISPSYMSPLILPGHVVIYQNPYQFQKSIVKRVIGVGGQRIATRPNNKAEADEATIELPDDVYLENTVKVEGNDTSTSNDDITSTSTTSDYPSLLQHLRRKQQQKKEMDEYYDLRLPPHYIYTEKDNRSLSLHDSSDVLNNHPVSQNLMIGIAEYVIWPPSRFQRIVRQPVYETISNHKGIYIKSRPRAIWDK